MHITFMTYLICCPLVFLAGLVDAIGGGGGLISLPAYLLAGLPAHYAIGTNKLSSCCGTTVATVRFIREGLVNWKLLLVVLPVTAFIVLNRHIFHDNVEEAQTDTPKVYVTAILAALIIGFYDGFYGPGTGTLLIIAFTVFAKLGIKTANGQTKVINLTTNITSLVISILHGQTVFLIGIPCAICNMIGNYIGAGLMMKNGMKIVRPSILVVLVLLAIKVVSEYIL